MGTAAASSIDVVVICGHEAIESNGNDVEALETAVVLMPLSVNCRGAL